MTLPARSRFTLLRVVGWPLVGLVTDVPQLAGILLAVTVGVIAVGLRVAGGAEATGLRWLVGILVFSTLALAFVAPSLQVVVAGLPNDHYHAFLDPVVVLLLAIPAGHLFSRASRSWRETRRPLPLAAVLAVGVAIAGLELIALERKPAKVDPDGGWPAARAAGERIVQATGGAAVWLAGPARLQAPGRDRLPDRACRRPARGPRGPDGLSGHRHADRRRLRPALRGRHRRACGGPAEDAFVADLTAT